MSIKAARGTKRLCLSCSSKFYDLNRDPIICPICQTEYVVAESAARSSSGNNLDAEDDAVLDVGRPGMVFVSLDEVAATEGEDLPDIEGGDLADVDDLDPAEEEAFLVTEDEGEADMSGFGNSGTSHNEER